MKRVIVVGAGLAGLSAGYRLQEAGWQVRVLESLKRVGGRVLTESVDGFVFDVGPTIVTDKYTQYMKLLRDVGLTDQLVDCAPGMGVVRGSDLHTLDTSKPLRSFLATGLLPARAKLRLVTRGVRMMKPLYGMDPADVSNRVQYDDRSIQTYVGQVFGRELDELFFEGLTRSMTTSSPDRASVLEFFAGAALASGKLQSIKGGLQRLPIEVAARLDVRLSSPVTGVRREGGGVEVQWRDASGASTRERAEACVIATPFRDATDMYPLLKEHGADLLQATRSAGCYSVQLMYAKRAEKEPYMVMVPTAASPEVGTLFLEHLKAPDRAPAGTSLITAFIPLQSGVDFSAWGDDRLIGTARELVERVFPELRGSFSAARLTRWPFASHQGNVGYYKALQRFLDSYPADDPVQVAGDYMATSGQESAVVAGHKAAQRILAAHSTVATSH
jgi:oxygen-dependent protoporphyrinogen oxidase